MIGGKGARIETASALRAARGRLMAGPSVVGGDGGPGRGISTAVPGATTTAAAKGGGGRK